MTAFFQCGAWRGVGVFRNGIRTAMTIYLLAGTAGMASSAPPAATKQPDKPKPGAKPAEPPAAKAVGKPAEKPAAATGDKKPAADADAKKDPPKVATVSLTTKDGVQLKLSYYAGGEGKDSVPVVMLHGFGGARADYKELAIHLQSLGHAVIVPDLRGHGDSTTYRDPRTRKDLKLNPKTMKPADFAAMVKQDMDAVRGFLLEKNNVGELNIRRLCIVGVDMGALVAMNWAADDWSWPDRGNEPQGKDVKGLVLLSPPKVFKGLATRDAVRHPAIQKELSIMIMVGDKEKADLADAKQLHGTLARFRPDPPKNEEQRREKQSLFLVELGTKLQGAKMLGNPELQAESLIEKFIDRRLVKPDVAWEKRRTY